MLGLATTASDESYGIRRGQGGVAVLWKRDLGGISIIKDIIHDRFCGIRLQTENGALINFISAYLPCQGSPKDYSSCLDDLGEIFESREAGAITIIGGDLNGDLGYDLGNKSSRPPSKQGRLLSEFVTRYNLYPVNLDKSTTGPLDTFNGPTGSSTIDYFLVPSNERNKISSCCVSADEPLNCSDHESLSIHLAINSLVKKPSRSTRRENIKWKSWDDAKIKSDYAEPLGTSLLEIINRLRVGLQTYDDIIYSMNRRIHTAAKALPVSKFRPNLKPFWSEGLTTLKKDKVTKFRVWKAAGRPRNPDSDCLREHKKAKKAFCHELRKLSKQYESDEILDAVNSADVNRAYFWRLLSKSRKCAGSRVIAIRNDKDEVVYEIPLVLGVWRTHFSKLCIPKDDPTFDKDHFVSVSESVKTLNAMSDRDEFLEEPFTQYEVQKAIKRLKFGKACGYDGITSEHLRYAGDTIVELLTMLFNIIVEFEYVPINMRRGIQIPLFKGKDLDSLEVNNYRGITLLTTLNKTYEMLLWGRLEHWWTTNEVISRFQGAGKKGISCVHTAVLLQETVASALETNRNVFVSYFDVSKAFDTVWTDGLFQKLHDMGVRGRMWRLLYRAYQDFRCCVRVEGEMSDWYTMHCGIHQGGYLSLTKYIAFINDLLAQLEQSQLCCCIHGIPSSPGGYAEDLATATTSKIKTDGVHEIVAAYGRKWRFRFIAKKSAVLVYGESKTEHTKHVKFREFKLGPEKVHERENYDHVGVKASIYHNDTSCISEKICKGRRTLNASTGLGIRRNGINMNVCNIIFWAVVIPIITFGCEMWVMSDKDIVNLQAFQRFAGRRVQRLSYKSPNASAFFGLGWTRIVTYIYVKKLLFVLTIVKLGADNFVKMIFTERLEAYRRNTEAGTLNAHRSPFFDIFNVCVKFDLLNIVDDMLNGRTPISKKKAWSKLCWEKAWTYEDTYWNTTAILHKDSNLLNLVLSETRYLTWWMFSDVDQSMMRICENMVKILCRASKLKCDDPSLKGTLLSVRTCENCYMYVVEDMHHLLMQCPHFHDRRQQMLERIYENAPEVEEIFANDPPKVFAWLLGKEIPRCPPNAMLEVWRISGQVINTIYMDVIRSRKGIG